MQRIIGIDPGRRSICYATEEIVAAAPSDDSAPAPLRSARRFRWSARDERRRRRLGGAGADDAGADDGDDGGGSDDGGADDGGGGADDAGADDAGADDGDDGGSGDAGRGRRRRRRLRRRRRGRRRRRRGRRRRGRVDVDDDDADDDDVDDDDADDDDVDDDDAGGAGADDHDAGGAGADDHESGRRRRGRRPGRRARRGGRGPRDAGVAVAGVAGVAVVAVGGAAALGEPAGATRRTRSRALGTTAAPAWTRPGSSPAAGSSTATFARRLTSSASTVKTANFDVYKGHVDAYVINFDTLWKEKLRPRWARQKFRLYCGKRRALQVRQQPPRRCVPHRVRRRHLWVGRTRAALSPRERDPAFGSSDVPATVLVDEYNTSQDVPHLPRASPARRVRAWQRRDGSWKKVTCHDLRRCGNRGAGGCASLGCRRRTETRRLR